MRRTNMSLCIILALLQCGASLAQDHLLRQRSEPAERLKQIEDKLSEALRLLQQTQDQVASLKAEMTQLRSKLAQEQIATRKPAEPEAAQAQTATPPAPHQSKWPVIQSAFTERILAEKLGEDERRSDLTLRPELFIQARYSTLPHKGATIDDIKSNFRLSRIESRWSGRISERLGAGLEIQYHPVPEGAPEELVNDAFMEYYLNDHVTLRIGQFIKPFGFDIQQSSSVRESPERAIFAGYFFPGQRDRGTLLLGDLDFLHMPALKNVQYYVGVFNGNRFFVDDNRQLNYNFRLRKRFESIHLAAAVSVQRGHQRLPPGLHGNNDENVLGVDLQCAYGRWGFRGEFVAGHMPSRLLSLQPKFAPAFRPGRHSSGGAVFATYRLTGSDNIYARYDQFNGDPVSGQNVRAFNFGYFRYVGESSRIGLDYQFKNRLSFNDDAINTRLQVTWGITF